MNGFTIGLCGAIQYPPRFEARVRTARASAEAALWGRKDKKKKTNRAFAWKRCENRKLAKRAEAPHNGKTEQLALGNVFRHAVWYSHVVKPRRYGRAGLPPFRNN